MTLRRQALICALVLVSWLAVLARPLQAAPAKADRIFVNGRIWTGDTAAPAAEALAVQGDRILAIGSNAQVRAVADPHTAIVDLKGRRVVPGFRDSHIHFPGPPIHYLRLNGSESPADVQRRVAEFARAEPDRAWLTGEGWTYDMFPGMTPHRRLLDAVVADRPMYFWDRDGHAALANSKALELGGITRATLDPPNGRIARDDEGEPTGLLNEAAMRLMDHVVPGTTVEENYETLVRHMDEAAAVGLTAAQNAWWAANEQPAFLRAAAAGALKLRFRFAAPMLTKDGASPSFSGLKTPLSSDDLGLHRELRATYRGPLLEFGAVKGFLDGTVDSKTAAMFEPYVGDTANGLAFWTQEDLDQVVALYDREGFQVLLHAIGDRAVRMALDAFENAARTNGTVGRRHRIEHVEVPALADLPRFRKLGVIASTQPLFARPDRTTLENYAVLLGPERASRANAFRLFDDAGAVQAFGSDWSVVDFSPLAGIYTAVTRMTAEGTPADGWFPGNRIPVEAALRHYTIDGAYASFAEDTQGSLVAGKLADFVVLSQDILEIPAAQILDTRVLLTVMGGRDTYRDAAFP